MMKSVIYLCLALLVSACAGKRGDDFRVSLGLVSAYDTAQTSFHQGLIMEPRERLLTISQDDEDYKKAQKFLKQELEPARLKLLRYYAQKGKSEEKKKNWAKAEEAYRMAAELSQQPEALKSYQRRVNLKVRQVRFDDLYDKQKIEDETWKNWKESYVPPMGLYGDDEVFSLVRMDIIKGFDLHSAQTWSRAQTYEKKDVPELAWLYADAYLRLSPGDKKAQDLKNAMKTAVPRGFRLPKDEGSVSKAKVTKAAKTPLDTTHVKGLMTQGKWVEAKLEALSLRKQGNQEADKLLEKIDGKIAELAEDSYQKGNLAFRSEKIDAAVKFWQRAVDLKPNEQTYMDSLRRGKQIQERLGALKIEGKQ